MCTSKELSHAVLPSHDCHVNQCVLYQNQDKPSKQWCPATTTSLCADKNCQSTQCEHMQQVLLAMAQSSHMQSVKPAMPQASHMCSVKPAIPQASHMWSVKPAMPQASYK